MKREKLRQRYGKRRRGSMLFLVTFSMALLLVAIGIGFSGYNLFFAHQQLQNWGENLAATSAQQLNINDHTGKLNNLLGHSRENVYVSRQLFDKTQNEKDFAEFAPLAAQLLDQARQGAQDVAGERDRYVVTTLASVRGIVNQAVDHPRRPIEILNLTANKFSVSELKLGCLERAESNVEVSAVVDDLYQHDLRQSFIRQLSKDTNLYRATIDLSLPSPDNDLHFRLSPIIAPVAGTTDPIHLTAGDHFKKVLALRSHDRDAKESCLVLPSAVQVVSTMAVNENMFGALQGSSSSTITACSNGACPETP
jgi:hypothetical protein